MRKKVSNFTKEFWASPSAGLPATTKGPSIRNFSYNVGAIAKGITQFHATRGKLGLNRRMKRK